MQRSAEMKRADPEAPRIDPTCKKPRSMGLANLNCIEAGRFHLRWERQNPALSRSARAHVPQIKPRRCDNHRRGHSANHYPTGIQRHNGNSGIIYFPNWLICGKSQYRYLWFFNTLWIALHATRKEPNSLKSARSSSTHVSNAISPRGSASIAACRTSAYLFFARSHCKM